LPLLKIVVPVPALKLAAAALSDGDTPVATPVGDTIISTAGTTPGAATSMAAAALPCVPAASEAGK